MRKKEYEAALDKIDRLQKEAQQYYDEGMKLMMRLEERSKEKNELIKKVADLTAENERIKKERDEALEKYHSALVRVTDYAVKESYSYANRFPEDRGLREEVAKE